MTAAILSAGAAAWEYVAKPGWQYLLPPVTTEPPQPPAGCYKVPWPPGSRCDDDKEGYYDDVRVSEVISRYGLNSVLVVFHSDPHVRTAAMRQMLVEIHIDLIKEVAEAAVLALAYQETALKAEQLRAEQNPLGAFRWQTKEELRRNMGEIKRVERNVKQLEQQAREEANALSSWTSPTSTLVEKPKGTWVQRPVVTFTTGPAYRQLQSISANGWRRF